MQGENDDKNKRKYEGGGANSTPVKSSFRPLIASSLALALGVSVASANPTFNQQGSDGSKGNEINPATNLSYGNTNISGTDYYTFKIDGNVKSEFKLYVTGDGNSWDPNGFEGKGQLNIPSNSILVSTDKGLAMGDSGDGTLTLAMYAGSGDNVDKSFILDLSGVNSSSYAFYGNLTLTGAGDGNNENYSHKTIIAKLGGLGIKGNVTLSAQGKTLLDFSQSANAKIVGDLIVSNGNNTIAPTSQNIFNGNLTVSGGTLTLLTATSAQEVSQMLATSNTLSGGTLVFGFDNSVNNTNKILNLDASASNMSKITFSGGTLAFDSAKKVYFNNGTTKGTGDGTLTFSNGAVKFIVDPSVTTANVNSADNAILKGNITANGGSVIFSLKDATTGINPFGTTASNASSISTYYVDGNITISSGGISAFWDDTYGFTAKIGTTAGKKIVVNGSLNGKNDAWFDRGTFTDGGGITAINFGNSGASHLVFEDNMNIANGISGRDMGGQTSQILFKGNATIGKVSGKNYAINIQEGGSSPTLEVTMAGDTNDVAGIFADGNAAGGSKTIKLFFTGESATNTISGNISSTYWNSSFKKIGITQIEFQGGSGSKNTISGNINTNGQNTITFKDGTNTISGNINTSGQNTITFENGANTISGAITTNGGGVNNITFENGTNTISGNINTSGQNTITFKDGTNTISGNIKTNPGGNNSITFEGGNNTISGNIVNDRGTTAITAETGSSTNTISGDITTKQGGVSTITLLGETNKITGSTISLSNGYPPHKFDGYNKIILGGQTSEIGSRTQKTDLTITFSLYNGGSYNFKGHNTIVANASTSNTLTFGSMNVSGNFGGGGFNPTAKTHNIISLNQNGNVTNTLSADSISSTYGNTIIGRDIINATNGEYASALFDNNTTTEPEIKSDFANTFMSNTYTAKGTYTIGTGNGSAISSASSGGTFINVENLTVNGDITAEGADGVSNYIYATTLSLSGKVSTITRGGNYIVASGNSTNNLSEMSIVNKTGHNTLILNGTTATVGSNTVKTNILTTFIKPDNGNSFQYYGSNTIVMNASTNNTLKLGNLSIDGNYGTGVVKNHHIISLNQNGNVTNTLSADSISSTYGNTIIGRDIINATNGEYASALFNKNTTIDPEIKSDFANTFMSNTYTAKGTYTIGTGNGNAIETYGGANYLNVENLTISGGIVASSGKNYIIVKGNSTNNLSKIALEKVTGSNTLILNGITTTVGNNATKTDMSISFLSPGGGASYNYYGSNTLVMNASESNILTLGEIGINGNFGNGVAKTHNIISLNQTSATNTLSADSISSTYGNTIIGRDIIDATNGEYASALFDNNTTTEPEIKSDFANTFMSNTYTAKGTYTIGASGSSSDAITANASGVNYLNVENLTVNGNIKSNSGGNYIVAGTFNGSGKVIATGSGNNNIIASNGTATFEGISTKDQNGTGGNSIDLGSGNITINARENDNTDANGKAVYAWNGDNSNSITASNIIVNGDIVAGGGDANTLNSFSSNSSIIVSGNISGNGSSGKNNFTLTADDATLTLKGANSAITTLTAFNGATNGNTLIIDGSLNANSTTINTLTNGGKLKVDFKGGTNATSLSVNTTALKEVTVTSGKNNTLILRGTGTTTISNASALTIGADKGITFNLSSGSSVTFTNGLTTQANGTTTFVLGGTSNTITATNFTNNGTHNYNVGASATLKYGASGLEFSSGENNINFNTDNSTLDWQNSTGTIASKLISTTNGTTNINFNSVNGTLSTGVTTSGGTTNINIADGKSGEIQGDIGNSGSGATNIFFASGNTASQLTLNKASGTYEISSLNTAGTNKTLSIAQGTTTISESVNVSANTDITFALADSTTLTLSKGMSSVGTSTISVNSAGSANSAILSGGNINVSQVNLNGTTTSALTLTATSTDITTLNANAPTSNTLILDGASSAVTATLHTINGTLDAVMKGSSNGITTLNLNGGTVNSVSATNGDATQNIINFNSGTTTITEAIDSQKVASGNGLALNINSGKLILTEAISTDGGGEIKMIINNATLSLNGNANKISSLSGNGVVDLAMADSEGNPLTRSVKARSGFKTLTIDSYDNGNNTFNLYVNTQENGKADKIEVTSGSGNATFTVMGNIDDILGITYSQTPNDPNNVLVATGTTGVEVAGGRSLIGYDIVKAEVIQTADGSVYLGKAISEGVAPEIKEVATSALTVNYDLFLANFNSLNKRMGELRENPHSNGVWARVFGGNMSNDFGAGSKTEYVTAQGGYDYSLTLGDAKNYIGVALAYGHSTTKSNALDIQASQGSIQLQDVKSNMVEVGIYNSYVADNGWYNDTIFKFDYIMSSFTMTDNLSLESKTNNFAMILSDEFGYRYKFAENEKGNWYIDPQVEVAFGYFNQSDFNRAMVATNSTLEATQDNILTLRTRAGLSLGKKFNTAKGFASLYVGAFYEYDYIEGGNAEVLSKSGIANPLDKLESNGRAIVNVGSNIGLTESARLYIDVEKSFGDKQRTFMQFNVGARYSF